MPVRKRRQKGLRFSDFALLLAVFKWYPGSEVVKEGVDSRALNIAWVLRGFLLVHRQVENACEPAHRRVLVPSSGLIVKRRAVSGEAPAGTGVPEGWVGAWMGGDRDYA